MIMAKRLLLGIQNILFYDTFTDTNGTAITAHTPNIDKIGGGWVVDNGVFEIQSNKAQRTGAGAPRGVVDVGETDITIDVDLLMTGAAGVSGLMFRYLSSNERWIFGWDGFNGRVILQEQNGGGLITRGTYTGYGSGETHNLKVVLNGTSIICQVDGIQRISFTSATHDGVNVHGIISNNVGGNTWDNVKIVETSV